MGLFSSLFKVFNTTTNGINLEYILLNADKTSFEGISKICALMVIGDNATNKDFWKYATKYNEQSHGALVVELMKFRIFLVMYIAYSYIDHDFYLNKFFDLFYEECSANVFGLMKDNNNTTSLFKNIDDHVTTYTGILNDDANTNEDTIFKTTFTFLLYSGFDSNIKIKQDSDFKVFFHNMKIIIHKEIQYFNSKLKDIFENETLVMNLVVKYADEFSELEKSTQQHRLTEDEINDLLSGKIFKNYNIGESANPTIDDQSTYSDENSDLFEKMEKNTPPQIYYKAKYKTIYDLNITEYDFDGAIYNENPALLKVINAYMQKIIKEES